VLLPWFVTYTNGWARADAAHTIIRRVDFTNASLPDTECADGLICGDEKAVYGDQAYYTHARHARLREARIKDRLMHRPNKHHPELPPRKKRRNRLIARVRAAVERPFAVHFGKDMVRGRYDRVDETPEGSVITDYKSSDVRDPKQATQKARDSLQLQLYALAHEAETGELPAAAIDAPEVHRNSPRLASCAKPSPEKTPAP